MGYISKQNREGERKRQYTEVFEFLFHLLTGSLLACGVFTTSVLLCFKAH